VKDFPPLCAILDIDTATLRGLDPLELTRAFLTGGARWIQVRAKHMDAGALLDLCEAVVALARPHDAMVIVNDRADIGRLAGADGVHVGQDDLEVEAVRRILGGTAIVGLSTHTTAQIDAAIETTADYIAIGPVFATATKDTGYEAVGLERVRDTVSRVRDRPVVAIGGITLENCGEVIAAGARSVAVIGDLLAGDPAARVAAYVRGLDAAGQPRPRTSSPEHV
jgi:thiamine-phosphate pyrophosphorylase